MVTGVGAQAGCPDGHGSVAAHAASVEDGATVVLDDGRRMRLAGMEPPLPAIGQPEGSPLADAARRRLGALVDTASLTLVAAADDPDRYGRVPAYLFVDGVLVQATMMAAGLGRARWLPGEDACLPQLIAAEGQARAGRLGIWAEPDYQIRDVDDLSLAEDAGLYEIVRGRVVSVNTGRSIVFVDFGRDYRSDFTVLVPGPVADRLAADGRPADELVGKTVEVRGMIERNNGATIRLNDPAEIAVVADGS